jgi:hypothetical protein
MVALGTLVAETQLIPIGRTPMRVLAVGLLSIIALGSGNLTGSASELRYNPPAKIFLAECDQSAMQIVGKCGTIVVISAGVTAIRTTNKHVGLAV